MNNIKINKEFKIAIYLIFIVYILLLIKILLFKNGDAFSLLNFIGKKSFLEKISYAQLIPFDTIKIFIFDSPSYLVSIENLFGNIVIFCPMGFLIPLLFKKIHNVISTFIISFGISLTIELIQLLTGLGFFDVDDIILNVLGGIIGYLILKILMKVFNKFFNN
ncbi:VanZ family protein (plasmid) [Clostridium perfringens]|uniref:VanZ family protein n=1 Tax=Clostridium perfringens TaxID=1502 RepID=UPI0024BC6665|nr:VanZ family protein [Clostridium perfringens]ELC8464115.1 VanZ family protein [Clostridium perfringens]MDT7988929.1 VanZ family protein [Clostridium perfringens]WVM62200.1 VanZ family protein [Clostridium perfringens]